MVRTPDGGLEPVYDGDCPAPEAIDTVVAMCGQALARPEARGAVWNLRLADRDAADAANLPCELDYPARYRVEFEHSSGGDSLLPPEDRGHFDGWCTDVDAADADEAERIGMDRLLDYVAGEGPDWSRRAHEDLTPRATIIE